jgi:PHD/YefM family antitoxin component YafN of YafNO toxin-antitoxin module
MAKSLTIDVDDIRPLTDFLRNTKTHTARLKKTKAPMVLTVNGSAALIVQDAKTYQRLRDRINELEYEREVVAAIRVGLADVEAGRVYPAREALKALGRELGVSR